MDVRAGGTRPLPDVTRYAAASSRTPAVVVDVGWVNGLAAIRTLGRGRRARHRARPALERTRVSLPLRPRSRLPGSGRRTRTASWRSSPRSAMHSGGPRRSSRPTTRSWARSRGRRRRSQGGSSTPSRPGSRSSGSSASGFSSRRLTRPGCRFRPRRIRSRRPRRWLRPRARATPCSSSPRTRSASAGASAGRRFAARRRRELERAYADAEPFAPMVQELIPGGDDELYTLGSYVAADGEPLGLFSGRKLRQTPPVVGTCRVGEAVWVPRSSSRGCGCSRASASTASRRSSSSAIPATVATSSWR